MSELVSQPRGFFQSLGPGFVGALSLTLGGLGAARAARRSLLAAPAP